jgi:D-alanine transaminase
MRNSIVYLNGKFLSHTKAKVSIFDRGLLFGDSVYEVIPVYAGQPFYLIEHLFRLRNSLEAIHFSVSFDLKQMEKTLLALLKKNKVIDGNCAIYVQITRGVAFPRCFYFSSDLKPTVFAMLQTIKTSTYKELCKGKSAITLSDMRWQYPHIKSTSLLPSVLLYDQVRKVGCVEGILLRDNYVTEGISSNVFIVKKNKVFTPPLSKKILSGVTRNAILQLLKKNQISFVEKPISAKMLFAADEIWITSSIRGIFPIVKLDKKVIGNGKPGEVWRRVYKLYYDCFR